MYNDDEIERFQENLLLIRKILGWSEEKFGDSIGVTRQTINNLETQKSKLTKTQYLAMRTILRDEISNSKEENEMLICLLETIIDNPEKYKTEEKKKILEKANMLAPAIITKTNSKKEVSNEFKEILEALGVGIGVAVTAGLVSILGGYFLKGKK